jgi:ABC-type enterochelin transport system ATPase subunit
VDHKNTEIEKSLFQINNRITLKHLLRFARLKHGKGRIGIL